MKTLFLETIGSVNKPMPRASSFNIKLLRRGNGTGTIKISLAWDAPVLQDVNIDGGVFIVNGVESTKIANATPQTVSDIEVRVNDKVAYIYTNQLLNNTFRFVENSTPGDNVPYVDYNFYMGNLKYYRELFTLVADFNREIYGLRFLPYDNPVYDSAYQRVFANCYKFNKPINHFDVSGIKFLSGWFLNCYELNQPMDRWDVSNITLMDYVFFGAYSANPNIGMWDVRKVTSMEGMFYLAYNFDCDLSKWKFNKEVNLNDFLREAIGFSPANYDKLLKNLKNTDFTGRQAPKILGCQLVKFTASGKADRDWLVADGWTITDGGQTT